MEKKLPDNIQGILIDFDGVISKKSIDLTIDFIHQYINKFTPLTRTFIRDYIRVVSSFSIEDSVRLFFTSFGLENKIRDFFYEYRNYDIDGKKLFIEKDFEAFLKYCSSKSIQYWIFSLANPERIIHAGGIDLERIYALKNRSKSDLNTYKDLSKKKGIDLNRWIYLDDNPLALRAGKMAGLNTIMMINKFYTFKDYRNFKNYIDFKVENFTELKNIFTH